MDIVREDVGLHMSYQASFIAPWCNSRGSKVVGLYRRSKKAQ
jgi:hypothetical protein